MWSRLVFGFLFVLQANYVSPLTNNTQITVINGETVSCSCKVNDRKSDILRQLLNQEIVIRMALEKKVHNIVKDMEKMTKIMKRNNKDFQEEIIALKYSNQELKISTKRQQREANGEIVALKKEIRSLKINDQSNVTKPLSDGLNTTIDAIKADLDQTKKTQLKLSSAVSTLEAFRNNMSLLAKNVKETRIGFTAGVTSWNNSWNGNILVFHHVVTNTGSNYNPRTWKFTAPRTGIYVFFVTVISYYSNYIFLDIVHNGADKVGTCSHESARYQTGTNLAVLELRQGDTVWVRRSSGQGYYSVNVPLTTFSGFLL